jgi:hypothetical protein
MPFSLSYDVTIHTQPIKKATKNQKKTPIITNQPRKLQVPNCNWPLQAQKNQRHDEYEL